MHQVMRGTKRMQCFRHITENHPKVLVERYWTLASTVLVLLKFGCTLLGSSRNEFPQRHFDDCCKFQKNHKQSIKYRDAQLWGKCQNGWILS